MAQKCVVNKILDKCYLMKIAPLWNNILHSELLSYLYHIIHIFNLGQMEISRPTTDSWGTHKYLPVLLAAGFTTPYLYPFVVPKHLMSICRLAVGWRQASLSLGSCYWGRGYGKGHDFPLASTTIHVQPGKAQKIKTQRHLGKCMTENKGGLKGCSRKMTIASFEKIHHVRLSTLIFVLYCICLLTYW